MKNMKKFLALGLATTMALSMAACGDDTSSSSNTNTSNNQQSNSGDNNSSSNNNNSSSSDGGVRNIQIGTWWVQYYDSDDKIEDSTDWQNAQPAEGDSEDKAAEKAHNLNVAQLKFDNVPVIEQKYNCEFYWNNLTYEGVKESINVSILAGAPDCDIYLTDAGMAIPAQMNGLAIDLKTVLPEDHDLFTTQQNMSYLDMGDGKACIIMRQEAQKLVEATYPLGFNVQMLEDAGLEDPRDLYERGEWTWEKFNEYLVALTQDTDGDGAIDQYGYCGYENETLEQLMMSNGGNIAAGKTEGLTSPEVGEALQQMYDMYNTLNVCYPYDFEGTPSDSMRNQYTQGNIAFFPIAAWIASGNNDYDFGDTTGTYLAWDTAYVRWPVGPSGDQETNAGKNLTSGEFYIIPAGVKDPETVVNVLYDYWNWYADDTSIRDAKHTLNWWYGVTARGEELQNLNFEVMKDAGSTTCFDLWSSMNIAYDLQSLIRGEVTPAQFQETYKQQVQDGLDAYFN
ncbi:MAG: hypothetical protein IJ379_05845 [Lachnospiraceae bacterium]|nr:hypothetical protein [Lachnospiraceae bacterium]